MKKRRYRMSKHRSSSYHSTKTTTAHETLEIEDTESDPSVYTKKLQGARLKLARVKETIQRIKQKVENI